jgi:hypothetical protein
VNVLHNKPKKIIYTLMPNQITKFYTQIRVKERLDVTNIVVVAKVTSALKSS